MYAAKVKERAAAEEARRGQARLDQGIDGRDATRLPGTQAS